jgi:phenylpropionate dioxygenase-like ring-hydroxylating dioxygenase large terminal subunit
MSTYANTRPPLSADVQTLPASYYSDPAQYERELRHIHSEMWLWAGRAEQVAKPGDFVVRTVAGANVIVLRGDDGAVRAFHNVCRHRGTLLCNEAEGSFPGKIRCPYHAWTYDYAGRLVGAPHMDKVEGFREQDHPLGAIAAEVWDGHVFINLSARPVPFEQHLGELRERLRPWRMEDLVRVERRVYDVRANWKLIVQNYSECLHCPIVHPLLNRQSHYMSGDNEPPQPTYLGGSMELRDGMKTLSLDGQTRRQPLPGLSERERRCIYYYALLPNLLLNLHPDYMLTFQIWPLAVDRTDVVCEWHFHPDAIAAADFDASDAVEFWDLTNRQDWELSERAHEGISTLGYRPGPYSNREELLVGFDRFVLERLSRKDGA